MFTQNITSLGFIILGGVLFLCIKNEGLITFMH